MATQSHKDIPDSQRHEPKGISTASSGEIYVADGAGSGSWKSQGSSDFANMYITNNTTTDAVTANASPHTDSNYVSLAGRYTAGESEHISISSGVITIPHAGIYELSGYVTAKHDTANATIYLAFKVNGVLGSRVLQERINGTGQYLTMAGSAIFAGALNDTIEVFTGSDVTGNVTINDSNISIKLLRDDS